ncbi:MAG: methyltransferase family protein [Promethearchaeota archaeon]
MPTGIDITIAIVLFGSYFLGAGVKRYNRKKGENIPTGKSPLDSNLQKIIVFSCLVALDIVFGFLAPFFLLFDIYHQLLDWSTLIYFISSANLLLILQILGCCLYVIGYIIYVMGRFELKGYFSELWNPAKLGDNFTRTGIYSRMRHPLYTGGFIFQIGLVILFQTWLGLLFFIPPTIITIKQALKEEQWMIERFGEEYKDYMKRTWRFFPKLW